MNRVVSLFRSVGQGRRKVLSIFTTFGFPSVSATRRVLKMLDREGVDLVELGFPFSDPLADGPTIQASCEQALVNHVHLKDLFRLVRLARRDGVQIPILLFSYYNPLLTFGFARAVREMARAGLDGVMIPDLAPEELPAVLPRLRNCGLSYIGFVAPTSTRRRILNVARVSHPFIYYVSRKGVTGERQALAKEMAGHLAFVRKQARKPVLVGFGITKPEHVRAVLAQAEGAIVGSAFITALAKAGGDAERVRPFIRRLVRVARG